LGPLQLRRFPPAFPVLEDIGKILLSFQRFLTPMQLSDQFHRQTLFKAHRINGVTGNLTPEIS